MKTLLLIVVGLAVVLVIGGLVIYLIGRAQPERHTARITFAVAQPRAVVWAVITDYGSMPQWWPAVQSVRLETKAGGEIITWNTDQRGQVIGFRTKEERAPVKLVREIVGEGLPFGGTWMYELADETGGTRVTITEDGFVTAPMFRGIAKLFMSPDATMRDYEKHFVAHLAAK